MANLLIDDLNGVRQMLGRPLNQSPSIRHILEELEIEYQALSNDLNNTGNAWAVDTYTLTTSAGTRQYQIEPVQDTDYFGKALVVTTTPDNDSQPEQVLEYTEIEHLPQEWAWLGQNQGQLLDSGHSAGLIAFFRKLGDLGEEIWCEVRPTPNATQVYQILYQVGNYWNAVVTDDANTSYEMPHSTQRFYVRALVARNLIQKGLVKWSLDPLFNLNKGEIILKGLEQRIVRYGKIYEEYKDSLENADITYTTSWANENVFDW